MLLGRQFQFALILSLSFVVGAGSLFAENEPAEGVNNSDPLSTCKNVFRWLGTSKLNEQIQRARSERAIRIISGAGQSTEMELEEAKKIILEEWLQKAKDYPEQRKKFLAAIKIIEVWNKKFDAIYPGFWKWGRTETYRHLKKGPISIADVPGYPSLDKGKVTANTSVLDEGGVKAEYLKTFKYKRKEFHRQRSRIDGDMKIAEQSLSEEDILQAVRIKFLGKLLSSVEESRPGSIDRILKGEIDPNEREREEVVQAVAQFLNRSIVMRAPYEVRGLVEQAVRMDELTENIRWRKVLQVATWPRKLLRRGYEFSKRSVALYSLLIAIPIAGTWYGGHIKDAYLYARERNAQRVAEIKRQEKRLEIMASIAGNAQDMKEFFLRNRREIITPDFRDEAFTILQEHLAYILDIELKGPYKPRPNLEPDGTYEEYIFNHAKQIRDILIDEIFGVKDQFDGAGGRMNRRELNAENWDEIAAWAEDNGLLRMGELLKQYRDQSANPPRP